MTPENLGQLQIELRVDEGFKREVYLDSKGIPSIGIGHNLRARPLPRGWTPPLTDVQIYTLFQNDLQDDALGPLDLHLPWWSTLDVVRQRVLANMCFNMGVNELLNFHNMLSACKSGDYDTAADQMKASEWYGQVGDRAVRLIAMMRVGTGV